MQSTRVCNVRVKYIRPQYHNLQQWCEGSNNVYIGRRGIVFIDGVRYPVNDSEFCNPFKSSNSSDVIGDYRRYLINRLNNEAGYYEKFIQLRGKNLGCWCAEYDNKGVRSNYGMCHGDVIIEILSQCE